MLTTSHHFVLKNVKWHVVFNILVDRCRLDKINILDTASLFPVIVLANNCS